MKHYFVNWLEERARKCLIKAEEYRGALESDTDKAENLIKAFQDDRSKILKWAERSEEDAQRFKKWARLAEDMISLDLEELALSYYDAKQAIEPWLLPPRPNKTVKWTLDGIAEQLELRIDNSNNPEELEQLRNIYTTLVELYSTGMHEAILTYYRRKIRQNSELNLPEPEAHPE